MFIWMFFVSVRALDPEIIDLLTPVKSLGEACGYDACPNLQQDVLNVHLVPYSHTELGMYKHFDLFWSGATYYEDMNTTTQSSMFSMKMTFDATITELWENRERKFTLSDSELPYFFHWWARRDSTVRRMVYELLRQGRLFIVGGGWSMQDEGTTSYHAIIDSYTYSLRKLNRTFLSCARPLVAWQADNTGHSREYASLLAQMGFDGLFISPISFDDELIRMERRGLEFLWRGSDDLGMSTDIFTHKLYDGYRSPPGFCFTPGSLDPFLVTTAKSVIQIEERADLFIDLMRDRQSPYYTTNHILVIMGGYFGYFAARQWFKNIDALTNAVNKKTYKMEKKIHLHYSTPHCYLKSVYEAHPILETKQDDFIPLGYDKNNYLSGCFTSRPDLKYFIRVGHVYLQTAKQLQVLAKLGHDKILDDFMWIMGVMQDHNIITGSLAHHSKLYYMKRLDYAIQRSMTILQDGFNELTESSFRIEYKRCEFNSSVCPFTASPTFHILLYNPLSWPVTMPVRIPVRKSKYIVYDTKGNKIKASLLPVSIHVLNIVTRETKTDHEVVFLANDIPGMGFKSYYFERVEKHKRSIIKKLNPHPQKKYYIRQASDVYNKTYFEEEAIYDDEDEKSERRYDDEFKDDKPNISFASVEDFSPDNRNVVTPKSNRANDTTEVIPILLKEGTDTYIAETSTIVTEGQNTTELKSLERTAEILQTTQKQTTNTNVVTEELNVVTERVEIATRTPKKGSERENLDSFYAVESKDNFIENKYIKIELDSYRKISKLTLSNHLNTSLDIQFYYYVSDEATKVREEVTDVIDPGPHLFRPMDPKPVPIMDYLDTKIYKTDVVQEVHSIYSAYASFVARLYKDSPCLELEWTVGEVPVDDQLGKEVFIRYTTELNNSGVFYTDSNGRQTVKRIRNQRATYEPYDFNNIAGNFYPVTSKIYIEDTAMDARFSILNDRAQGGTSLIDGAIDMMVVRRILTDETGIGLTVNDTIDGKGVIVSGKHYLYLSKSNYRPNRAFEKKLAKEIELKPLSIISDTRLTIDNWLDLKMEFAGINRLPFGVHVLTLQNWNDGTLLVRLENFLEKSDVVKTGVKYVFLKRLFYNIEVERVRETTLAANVWLSDWTPLRWEKNGSFLTNFNKYYGTDLYEYDDKEEPLKDDDKPGIKLVPQQIRTFVVWFKSS
ncbi:unnamed protein product [Leptosia nina]|uniref:Alpha-mannosidase n=1 Tax=Leptosia nina TaxID=320188 RepID=A0AAV1JYJ5_9NEOP